jgi:dipeptidyl aminopeptidase/acylaminoacyl peptidase
MAPHPYGTWPSSITAQVVAAQGLRLGYVALDGEDVYWVEGRPSEGGRNVLVRRGADGRASDLTPPGFNVRTRVHEYGGGSYVVSDGVVYFSNFSDQRIYRTGATAHASTHREPIPITPPGDWFYADATVDARRRRLICVREDHSDPNREPVNTLVAIPLDGGESAGEVIASGYDFYSTPRLSPDGSRLAWLAWRHPQMPWDGTELWVASVAESGSLDHPVRLAGGPSESICQPGWMPDGTLCFASDRDGWWRLYRSDGSAAHALVKDPPARAEFGRPQWVFGSAPWAAAGDGRMVVSYAREGLWYLAALEIQTGKLSQLVDGVQPREWLTATSTHAVLVAGSATTPDAVIRVDLRSEVVEVLQASSTIDIDEADISVPESVVFPSPDGHQTHAFYYPPRHAHCTAPDTERPPLMLISHGGPTSAASATLDLKVQYWTNRGFAVADVNYGGSSGFGRPYRERLNGQWGIVDVADMVGAAQYLVAQGKADPDRLVIRGGSAGGYTTLAALSFHPEVFKAGASYYGISDIEVLARDTHKFESRYLETLVGPYPASRDLYRARSPIHVVDRLACPLILFQGLEDKVVPPNQSEMMAAAVRAKGLPVAYLAFEGEQHGFRKATTIIRSLEAELYFYGAVFGFSPADITEPVAIDNLPRVKVRSAKFEVDK